MNKHPAARKIEDIGYLLIALAAEIDKGNLSIVPCSLMSILKLLLEEIGKWTRELN